MSDEDLPIVMSVVFYADESEATGFVFTLAGFLASPSAWNLFIPKWQQMLRDTGPYAVSAYHSADIEAAQKEFDGWPPNDRKQLVTNALGLLADTSLCSNLYAVSATYVIEDFKALDPRLLGDGSIAAIYDGCYRVLFHTILSSWPFNDIEFVFDEKEKVKGRVQKHFDKSKKILDAMPGFKGRLGQCSFRDDRKVIPLQAADLLAFEIRRHTWTRITKGDVQMRGAYQQIKDSFAVSPEEPPYRQRLFRCYDQRFFKSLLDEAAKIPNITDDHFIDLWYFHEAPED